MWQLTIYNNQWAVQDPNGKIHCYSSDKQMLSDIVRELNGD